MPTSPRTAWAPSAAQRARPRPGAEPQPTPTAPGAVPPEPRSPAGTAAPAAPLRGPGPPTGRGSRGRSPRPPTDGRGLRGGSLLFLLGVGFGGLRTLCPGHSPTPTLPETLRHRKGSTPTFVHFSFLTCPNSPGPYKILFLSLLLKDAPSKPHIQECRRHADPLGGSGTRHTPLAGVNVGCKRMGRLFSFQNVNEYLHNQGPGEQCQLTALFCTPLHPLPQLHVDLCLL